MPNLQKTIELGIVSSLIAILLAACGGGGGTSPSVTPPPNTPTVSTNQVEIALTDGLFHLWGFGYIVNGVQQVFISRTNAPSGPSYAKGWSTTNIFGVVSNTSTAPRLDDSVRLATSYWWWSFPASSSQASLTVAHASSPTWTMTLNQQDISGQPVISQIKRNDGVLISTLQTPALADASAVFPAGSIAYTANFTNVQPMRVSVGSMVFVNSEATLFGSGWCYPVPGQTYKLGVQINAGGSVSLFSVSGACNFAGLTAIGTGSWVKNTVGSDIVYAITYPATLTTDPLWASAFANSYAPTANLPNQVINPIASPTLFYMAVDIPSGQTFTSLQPFFNATALPGLRAAAGI